MRSFYVSIVFSGVLEVAQYVYPIDKPITNQPVLELVFSFMLLAVCSAIFFFMDASSGGTDIIALILKKYTSVSIGMALLLVDFAVVLISFFVYNPTVGLFSFAGFLAKSFFIDSVIESLNLCKYFTIVSDNADTICDYIHKELNHSATIMSAEGSYSHEPKKVIMTVVNRDQALKLRKFVRSVEPHAFMMITNSSEIIGKESTILTLIKGSNWRLSVLQSRKSGVCDVVSTMSDHPYRNEMVRLLLHIFGVQ